MTAIRLLIGALSACLLASCTTIEPEPSIAPPQGSTEVLRLDASGEQIFRCTRDSKGWFWHFESPNAYLFEPVHNQAVAKHGFHFSFVHNDGSKLVTRIIRYRPKKDALSEALFSVTEPALSGQFAGVRFVQRINTLGGLPDKRCTEARQGELLHVPFQAQFVFYR